MKHLISTLLAAIWVLTTPAQAATVTPYATLNQVIATTGALKSNGSGTVTRAACADLSNGAASCSTDTTNASNISSGTLAAARGGAGTVNGALKGNGSGVVSQAACGDLSNAAASCSTDTTNASNISSGTLGAARLPNPTATTLGGIESITASTHKWINSISTLGVPTQTQPACGDLSDSGTACTAVAPANTTATTHNFFTAYTSATGAFTKAQPACGDLSDSAASCNTDATNASNISSGTLNTARLPSPFTSGTASGNTSKFGTTSGTLTSGHCVQFDASGNLVDAGAACGTGSGAVSSVSGDGTYITNSGSTGAVTLTTTFGNAAQKTVGTSGATVPLLNGSNTASGNNVQSGSYAVTATTTPTQAAGTLGIAGTATAPTLGANSEGDLFLTSTGGLNLIGQGSTNDYTLLNKSGSSVCTVATGTTNYNCTGLQVGGTNVLTANQSITLSGDTTGSGSTAITTTTVKVNGVSYPATPSTHQVPVITASNTATYKTVPDCQDSAGNHLNYTQSTDSFSCGTTDSHGGTVTSVTFTGDGIIDSATPSTAVTTSGTVQATALTQTANTILAGPASGSAAAPTFRAQVDADLPLSAQFTTTEMLMSNFEGL